MLPSRNIKNNTVRAFTLIELIVAMVISTIVIAAAITVLLGTQQLLSKGITDSYSESQALLFVGVMRSDFERSDNALVSGGRLQLTYSFRPPVEYEFGDSSITRHTLDNNDVFRFKITRPFFRTSDVLKDNIVSMAFTCKTNTDTIPVLLIKQYSRSQIFNIKNHEH